MHTHIHPAPASSSCPSQFLRCAAEDLLQPPPPTPVHTAAARPKAPSSSSSLSAPATADPQRQLLRVPAPPLPLPAPAPAPPPAPLPAYPCRWVFVCVAYPYLPLAAAAHLSGDPGLTAALYAPQPWAAVAAAWEARCVGAGLGALRGDGEGL